MYFDVVSGEENEMRESFLLSTVLYVLCVGALLSTEYSHLAGRPSTVHGTVKSRENTKVHRPYSTFPFSLVQPRNRIHKVEKYQHRILTWCSEVLLALSFVTQILITYLLCCSSLRPTIYKEKTNFSPFSVLLHFHLLIFTN